MTEERWRKSSRSGSNSNCVELRHDGLAVRDSKNPDGPRLVLGSPAAVAALISWIKKTD